MLTGAAAAEGFRLRGEINTEIKTEINIEINIEMTVVNVWGFELSVPQLAAQVMSSFYYQTPFRNLVILTLQEYTNVGSMTLIFPLNYRELFLTSAYALNTGTLV